MWDFIWLWYSFNGISKATPFSDFQDCFFLFHTFYFLIWEQKETWVFLEIILKQKQTNLVVYYLHIQYENDCEIIKVNESNKEHNK